TGVFVPLTAAALAFTLLWLRVQVRHWRYCVHVNDRIKGAVPESARTVAAFASPGCTDGLSISRPLAFAVPLLFAATWLALFAWVLPPARVSPGGAISHPPGDPVQSFSRGHDGQECLPARRGLRPRRRARRPRATPVPD